MKINLGFEDFPYSGRYSAKSPLTATVKKRRQKRLSPTQKAYGGGKTTKEVAAELEKRYKIVETFYKMEGETLIDPILEKITIDALISELEGHSYTPQLSASDAKKIESKFKENLTSQRYDGIISGVPTLASIRGVSHLRSSPYSRSNPSRPSFIDTGMYMRSFRATLEE